jgi:hypothetical protein
MFETTNQIVTIVKPWIVVKWPIVDGCCWNMFEHMIVNAIRYTKKHEKNSRHDFVSETNRVCCPPGTWNRTSTQTRLTRLLISIDPRPIHPFTSYLTILLWIGFLINLTSNQCPKLLNKRMVGSWLIPSIIIYKPLVFQG